MCLRPHRLLQPDHSIGDPTILYPRRKCGLAQHDHPRMQPIIRHTILQIPPTKTKREEDGKSQATKVARKAPTESAIAKAKAKLYKVKKQKPKPKVTPQPCKYPGSRPCITQKEIDQGWHDKKGCYNRSLFFTYGITHCWEEGDDCVKPDCRY
ncbi:hypothetical protein H4I95_08787 [Botrytis cinerea]